MSISLLASATTAAVISTSQLGGAPILLGSDILVCRHKADVEMVTGLLDKGDFQEANRVVATLKCGYVLEGNRLTVVRRDGKYQEIRLLYKNGPDTVTMWTDELSEP